MTAVLHVTEIELRQICQDTAWI